MSVIRISKQKNEGISLSSYPLRSIKLKSFITVVSSRLVINEDKTFITLVLSIDTNYGSVMDYFEIFLKRMIMCRRAAERLNCKFKLVANGNKIC